MRLRRLWPAALLALAPVLAACGDDEPDAGGADDPTTSAAPTTEATESPTESASTTEPPTEATSEPPASDLPPACDLITRADVEKAMGVTFGPAELGGGTTTEQDLEWRSDNCSFEATDLVEVTVKVTGPGDFVKGAFSCPQPLEIASIIEPADDVPGSTEGWWKVSDAPPLKASLRACSESANVEVQLEYEDGVDYEGDPRQQAAQLAGLVLSGLQG